MKKIAAGFPFGFDLMFAPDLPTGAISYTLLGTDNSVRITSSVTPPAGAISYPIVIPASDAVLTGGRMFENRTVTFSYTTINGVVSGTVRYRVDAFLPFAASNDGVRMKIGVLDEELLDDDIDLMAAYLVFRNSILDQATLAASALSGSLVTILVTNAIEAAAAVALLPTLQIKLAVARTGGTNTFERTSKMDWDALRKSLEAIVAQGQVAIDIPTNPAGDPGFIFGLSFRTDPVTNK